MQKKAKPALKVFKTDRRIRLGIWGLGRGMSFYRTCRALNIDVVAGCDFNAHMRDHFLAANPGATVTADADAFLAQDFDAVLLATFCPAHAADAICCLEAGKHVLSEVTAFHTLAEGVRLVEAVERSGKVYNLAENYPWTPTNSWLARQWKTGIFGELMYAEYEYVHEVRSLCYTYIDGLPVQPGHHVHSWRSWLNYHYYNTHSLGPAMVITGTRPVRVVALPGAQQLAGYPGRAGKDMGGIAPSLITMNNGGIVRNLMGATTSDTHAIRLWGTRGAAEKAGHGLHVRLGGSGDSPMMEVRPSWDSLGELAAQTGHGGGDFWVLYYFARQILEGTPSPWDLYPACDVTIPGMQAYRSSLRDGEPQPCPDLRDPAAREACRHDDWRQEHLDPQEWAFPGHMRDALAESFSSTMKDLIRHALTVRAALDWEKVLDDAVPQVTLLEMVDRLIAELDDLKATYAQARRIIDTHPQANAARVLREMLEDVGAEAQVLAPGFTAWARRPRTRLVRLLPAAPLRLIAFRASALQPKAAHLAAVRPPRTSLKFQRVPYDYALGYADVRPFHGEQDGLLYVRATATPRRPGKGLLRFGADGPVKVWINGKLVATELAARNPILPMRFTAKAIWRRGRNEILFALDSRKGQMWGLAAACESIGKG